jgi:hypothetical protein
MILSFQFVSCSWINNLAFHMFTDRSSLRERLDPDNSSDWQHRSEGRARNSLGDEETEEVDEENWHVGILCARVFAIILLLAIIVLFSLGAIYSTKLVILAGIISGVMILIIVASFYQFSCCKYLVASYISRYNSRRDKNIQAAGRSASKQNSIDI